MSGTDILRSWWWLIHKDLLREFQAPRILPGMLWLGIVLSGIVTLQVDWPREYRESLTAGLFWLAAFFAGTVALDQSFSAEHEDGCWQALRMLPVAPATIFLAKTVVNFLALCCLDCVLIPAFLVFSDVALCAHPGRFLLIVLLANLGVSAAGTLISALTIGLRQRGGILVLLLLPLISPVMLAAAQSTRLLLSDARSADAWLWNQLLLAFAAVFLILGTLVFDLVVEE